MDERTKLLKNNHISNKNIEQEPNKEDNKNVNEEPNNFYFFLLIK